MLPVAIHPELPAVGRAHERRVTPQTSVRRVVYPARGEAESASYTFARLRPASTRPHRRSLLGASAAWLRRISGAVAEGARRQPRPTDPRAFPGSVGSSE